MPRAAHFSAHNIDPGSQQERLQLGSLLCGLLADDPSCCAMQIADTISELKLGNGTSILIFANIASGLPTSVGAALTQAATKDSSNLAIYSVAFFLTTLGIVYVQEADLPFKVGSKSDVRAGMYLCVRAYSSTLPAEMRRHLSRACWQNLA